MALLTSLKENKWHPLNNHHKLSGLTQHKCLISQFLGSRVLAQFAGVLCPWSHRDEITVSASYILIRGTLNLLALFRALCLRHLGSLFPQGL